MFKSIEDYLTLVGVTLTITFGTKKIITIAACKSKLFVEIFSKIILSGYLDTEDR